MLGKLWQHKSAIIAVLCVALIAVHLVLRFGLHASLSAQHLPLFITLFIGGLPMLYDLLLKLLKRECSSDLLGGLSIITSLLLGKYLAGSIIVLMLAGGEALESYSLRSASSVLAALAKRMPSIAHRKSATEITDVALADIAVGDTLVIYPHEICPADGEVTEGHGVMDESYLMGEPFQITKTSGSTVSSGAVNGESALTIRTTKLAADSRYAKIMEVMRESESKRPQLRRLGDQLGAIYTPVALTVAILAWAISGEAIRFLAVLVIPTPCPLLIGIPIAIIGSISLCARRAIIVKSPVVLEQIAECRTAILDKTGTLTYGEPTLTEQLIAPGFDQTEALTLVASLERYSRYLLSAMTLLVLSSCADTDTGAKIAGAVVVPAKWQHRAMSSEPLDTRALTTWWKHFHDPILDEVIAGALSSSTDVRTALSLISEYRALRGVETAGLFPTLDLDVSGQGSRRKDLGTKLTTTTESYQAALSPRWEVDLFGRQMLNVRAASSDLAQVNEDFYAAQVTLAAEVATAYVTLRSAEAELEVVQNSLGTRRETVQLTRWSEEAGIGTALDSQQSISTLEQARATIPTLQLSIAQSRNLLTLLSGRTPGSLDSVLAKHRNEPTMPTDVAIGIPAETLRQRPDVRAAERGVEAAFARTKNAQRERLPTLNLSGSLGVEALKAGRLFSPQTIAGSVIGSLAAPIFDAGRIRNNIIIQSEREKRALIAYESTVLTSLAEVEDALIAVQRYSERLDILSRAVSASRKAVNLSGMQFKAGEIDLFVSLDDQRNLLGLEQQEVVTRADRAKAFIQLYKALGGGWSPHEP